MYYATQGHTEMGTPFVYARYMYWNTGVHENATPGWGFRNTYLRQMDNICNFLQDPIDEMASLDNDAYLNSLEQYMVNTTWSNGRSNTPNTNL